VIWRYIGDGRALLDIPARDLYDDDALTDEQVALLAVSGLYVPNGAPLPVAAHGSIDLADGVSDGEAHLAGKALRSRRKE